MTNEQAERATGLRIIVCGGRAFRDCAFVDRTLDELHAKSPIRHLFHGNAAGVDSFAGYWAQRKPGVSEHAVPAQWSKYGLRAGPIRNQKMLGNNPHLVIAFPGGKGTADMVSRARKAGVTVIEPTPNQGSPT